jgi:hypothetical protein
LKPALKRTRHGWLVILVAAVAAGILFWRWPRAGEQGQAPVAAGRIPAATNRNVSPASAGPRAPSALELSRRESLFASFQKHPFAAVKTNSAFGWTVEDGTKPEVIRQLAHNELEFERMAAESDRVFRRQLVYHNDTVAAQIERAKLTGVPLSELQLPGLDGQEIQFQIASTDLSPSAQQGSFSGRVAGRPDSAATFAFKGGREAFTIISPADNLYLFGEPREPGEIIVKSVDISKYPIGAGDDVMPASHK